MIIISYDIAIKSLAVSIFYVNENWKEEMSYTNNILCSDFDKLLSGSTIPEMVINAKCVLRNIKELDEKISNIIQPLFCDVVDLIPNKKIKETDVNIRSSRLKGYLNRVDTIYIPQILENISRKMSSESIKEINSPSNPIKILLEYQMGPNDKSRNVCSQILYHYSTSDNQFKTSLDTHSNAVSATNVYDIEIIGPSLKNKLNFNKSESYSHIIKKYVTNYNANKKHSVCNMLHWLSVLHLDKLIKKIKKSNLDDVADSFNMAIAWIFLKSGIINAY